MHTLCAHIGLNALAVGACTGVDMFAGSVAAHERDGFDQRMVAQEVDAL